MADARKPIFVNTTMDEETLAMLTAMAKESGFEFSRSAFIRQLIRKEYSNRFGSLNVTQAPQTAEALS